MPKGGNGGGGGKGPKPPKIIDQAFATDENPTDGYTIGFVEADVKPNKTTLVRTSLSTSLVFID